MGLDLNVEGKAIPGHEAEWESLIRRHFTGEQLTEADIERFQAVSQPAHASVGAPQVGFDLGADDWIAEKTAVRMTREQAIAEYHGYHVLALVACDGLPKYTHAGLYEGVDETSFCGAFLSDCTSILTQSMIDAAWEHRMPDEAVEYGKALLAAAHEARQNKAGSPRRQPFWRGLISKQRDAVAVDDQLDIVETAGRWFVFWGSRGHPIHAYF